MGKNLIRTPTAWPPGGRFLGFFWSFFDNFRRRLVRVLKLHRVWMMTNWWREGIAPRSAHARPSAHPPIDVSRNFRHTCLQSHLQASPLAPQKNLKNRHAGDQGGEGGRGQKKIYPNFLGAHAKIWNPTSTPSWVLNNGIKNNNNKESRKDKRLIT